MQKINHVYGPYSLLLLGEEEEDVWSTFVHIHFDEGFFFFLIILMVEILIFCALLNLI
jgi:hypothetical protein